MECRVDHADGAKQVVLGDPQGDRKTTVVVRRGEFTSTVFANEVFGADEVVRFFLEYCDHGSIPSGVTTRPIETSRDLAEEGLGSVVAPPTGGQGCQTVKLSTPNSKRYRSDFMPKVGATV